MPKSVAQRNAHASGGADGLRIGGDEFRLARDLGKRIVGNGIADHRDGLTVIFRRDQLRGVHAEDGGKHAVVGARGTAALHMTRHMAGENELNRGRKLRGQKPMYSAYSILPSIAGD